MVPMIQYSDYERERFADFASLLLICRTVLRDLMEQTRLEPTSGSAADRDVQELTARTPAVHPMLPQLVAMTTQMYLYAASELIASLAAAYAQEEVLYGSLVLARSAIEHCAHVIWILGPGGAEPVEGRVARALLDELNGATQALRQTDGLAGKDSADHDYRVEKVLQFEEAARELFGETIQVKKRYHLGGRTYPGHKALVVHASAVAKTNLSDEVIAGTYALMSNSVHPTPHAIRELFRVERQGTTAAVMPARPPDFHENLAKMVVFFFYNALTYAMSYNGLDPTAHQVLGDAIDLLMSDLFVGPRAPGPFDDEPAS